MDARGAVARALPAGAGGFSARNAHDRTGVLHTRGAATSGAGAAKGEQDLHLVAAIFGKLGCARSGLGAGQEVSPRPLPQQMV